MLAKLPFYFLSRFFVSSQLIEKENCGTVPLSQEREGGKGRL